MLENLRKKFGRKMKVLNTVELSAKAVKANYLYFKKKHPESAICPVLKSNAYGHGLVEIAQIVDKFNAPYIVVDSFYEVFELKNAGIKTPFLIIGYTLPENYKHMSFKNIAVTVLDLETLNALGKLNKKIKIHLKVDTGMHRQGVPFDKFSEALQLIKKFKKLEFEGICTHLADSEHSKINEFTKKQIDLFRKSIKMAEKFGFDVKWKHISATHGAAKINSKDFNLIRLGLGLYGDSALEYSKLKPVLRLNSTLIDIKTIEKGDCVSYGCTFHADKKMKIGIIPVGYYEGVERRLSSVGFVYYGKTECRILGRVCMNLCVIDLSKVKAPKKWAEIEVIGDDLSKKNCAKWIAEKAGTITYVIWTKLAPTIRRVIRL